jgi:hypothetical protein
VEASSLVKPPIGSCVLYEGALAVVVSTVFSKTRKAWRCSLREFFSDRVLYTDISCQWHIRSYKFRLFRCKDRFTYSDINSEDLFSVEQVKRAKNRADQNDLALLVEQLFYLIKTHYLNGTLSCKSQVMGCLEAKISHRPMTSSPNQ